MTYKYNYPIILLLFLMFFFNITCREIIIVLFVASWNSHLKVFETVFIIILIIVFLLVTVNIIVIKLLYE